VNEQAYGIGGVILTGETRNTPRKTCPSATVFTTNSTWTGRGLNPGFRGERPATNRVSFGIADYQLLIWKNFEGLNRNL
jgi:hypothetical protein